MALPFEIGRHYPLKVNIRRYPSSSEIPENSAKKLLCFQYPFKPAHCDDGPGHASFDTKDKKWVVKLSTSKRTLSDFDSNGNGNGDCSTGETEMEIFKGFDTETISDCLLSFKGKGYKSGNGENREESKPCFVIESVSSISRLKHIKPGEESHVHAKQFLEARAEQRAIEDHATERRYKSIASGATRRKLNPTSSK